MFLHFRHGLLRDGTVLEHGHKGARDDAMSDATWYINQVLRAQGAQEVIFKPDHWTRKVQLRLVSLAKLRWGEPGRSQPGGKPTRVRRKRLYVELRGFIGGDPERGRHANARLPAKLTRALDPTKS